jgi:hypothetical protein
LRFPIDAMLRELKTRFRGSSLPGALATALAVVAAGCGGEVPLVSPEGATLSINANPTVIPIINGESTITVVAFKAPEDGGGTVADGTQIFFSTSVGVIEERVETQSGIARATLRSNGRAGTATITASSGSGITATLENGVLIGNGEGVNIVLTANPATVVSPDFTSDLTATAFDNANNPLRDVPILFTTTAGVLASRGSVLRTNANGQATDRLTLLTESSASVTAISGSISSNSVTVSRGTASEPLLTSLSPFTGAQGQTLTVTLNGLNFQPGAAASFGEGIAVQDVDFVSPTALRARITISPAATDGSRTVTVTNPDGGTATLADGFLVTVGGGGGGVGGVSVVSVSPSDGNQGDNLNVTIIGTNFQAGATVGFGAGITVNSVSFVSATELDADITVSLAAAGGPRTVTVVNPDASSGSLAAGFTVIAPPVVSAVTPTNGNPGQVILSVEINGANFQSGATVSFGAGITVDQVLFFDSTILFVDITIDPLAAPGVRAVSVTNPDGGTDSLAAGFTVN